MIYRVEVSKQAAKALSKLERPIAQRVVAAIETLASQPRPVNVKKLAGSDEWRVRVGDYRVIYTVDDDVLFVWVVKIGNRRDVYER